MLPSALELAARIRRREQSSEEVVRTCLERIEALDPRLSAFTDLRADRALAQARRKDARPSEAPFHGVPIGIKDLNLVRFTFSRFGSRAFRWLYSPIDDAVAAAVRRAGFVIVGKLATSEFGALPVTEPDVHPPTRNPWDPERTPGGSSGGSGAAVAAGMLPLAQGSDGGGSIRIPSAFCHLYGLKTSRGLTPLALGGAEVRTLAVEGPLAHTVADAQALVEVLAGRPIPECRPLPRRLRIRYTTTAAIAPTAPAVADATVRVARLLAELGHDVDEGPAMAGELEPFLPIWARLAAGVPLLRESHVEPVTRWLREIGRRTTREDARTTFDALVARVAEWWGDADLWVTPTVADAPPPVGAARAGSPEDAFRAVAWIGQFTAAFNLSGQPAASIPAGLGPEGLPIGVQVAGRLGEDRLVLEVSRALEEAMPWRSRMAPLVGGG